MSEERSQEVGSLRTRVGFWLVGAVFLLLLARLLSGLGTGIVTATATAALSELTDPDSRRASVVATAASMGGLGLGTTVAGLVAQWSADPVRTVFVAYLVALVPALLALGVVPETVARSRPLLAVRTPMLPRADAGRVAFLAACAAVFAAFAVTGLYSSLVPSFLRDELHVGSEAAVGTEVGLLFGVALVAQIVAPERWLRSRVIGPPAAVVGVVLFGAGLWTRSLPLFVAGTVACGVGIGLAVRHGVVVTDRHTEAGRRADLTAFYYLAAYVGNILPTLALGALDQVVDHDVVTLVAVVAVAAVTLAAALSSPAPRVRPERTVS